MEVELVLGVMPPSARQGPISCTCGLRWNNCTGGGLLWGRGQDTPSGQRNCLCGCWSPPCSPRGAWPCVRIRARGAGGGTQGGSGGEGRGRGSWSVTARHRGLGWSRGGLRPGLSLQRLQVLGRVVGQPRGVAGQQGGGSKERGSVGAAWGAAGQHRGQRDRTGGGGEQCGAECERGTRWGSGSSGDSQGLPHPRPPPRPGHLPPPPPPTPPRREAAAAARRCLGSAVPSRAEPGLLQGPDGAGPGAAVGSGHRAGGSGQRGRAGPCRGTAPLLCLRAGRESSAGTGTPERDGGEQPAEPPRALPGLGVFSPAGRRRGRAASRGGPRRLCSCSGGAAGAGGCRAIHSRWCGTAGLGRGSPPGRGRGGHPQGVAAQVRSPTVVSGGRDPPGRTVFLCIPLRHW